MTKTTNHSLGLSGEDLAAALLHREGMRILARRFRRRGGEIDLICALPEIEPATSSRGESSADIAEIVFVEVKTRSNRSFGSPEAAVSAGKRMRISRTAEVFLAENGLSGIPVRFDVVVVRRRHAQRIELDHLVDAFGAFELMDQDPWNEWRM